MASPAEEAQVREATRRVIQGVDLETVKEKQIVEMVEAQLGILLGDDEALMRCLQEEIETFLLDDTAVAKAGPGQTKPSKTAAAKRRRSVVEDEDDFNEDPEDGDWDHTQEDEDDDVDLDEDELEPKKRKDDMNAAREKWSEPAPAPTGNVVLTAGAPAAPVRAIWRVCPARPLLRRRVHRRRPPRVDLPRARPEPQPLDPDEKRPVALRDRRGDPECRRGAARLRRRGWAASPICSAQGCPTKSGSAPANAVRTTLQRVLCDVPAMRKGPLS